MQTRGFTRPLIFLFLHGSGDSGPGFRHAINSHVPIADLLPENAVALFPTAPSRPYTPIGGETAHVWFDRPRLHYDETEDPATLASSISYLEDVLDNAVQSPKSESDLYLVGFSMGGSMALHLALHRLAKGSPTAGVFVHSSFVGRTSKVIPAALETEAWISAAGVPPPPVTMVHGSADEMVPSKWGRNTARRLRESGFEVQYEEISGLRHEVSTSTIEKMLQFASTAKTIS